MVHTVAHHYAATYSTQIVCVFSIPNASRCISESKAISYCSTFVTFTYALTHLKDTGYSRTAAKSRMRGNIATTAAAPTTATAATITAAAVATTATTATESVLHVTALIAAINSADALFKLTGGSTDNVQTASDNSGSSSTDDSFQTILDISKRDDCCVVAATKVRDSVAKLYDVHWANYCSSIRRSVDSDASSKAARYARVQQHVDKWQRCIEAAPALLERFNRFEKRVDPRCIELYELNVQRLQKGVDILSTAVKQLVSTAT
jgi:hypothetical protein